jgi:hypothetical protein
MGDVNGNSLKSKFFSSQISKSMWENGYNVYSINLEKVTDEITDSLMKSFQLIYTGSGISINLYWVMNGILGPEFHIQQQLVKEITIPCH